MADSTTEHEQETERTMPSDDERTVMLDGAHDGVDDGVDGDLADDRGDTAEENDPSEGGAGAVGAGRKRGRRARRAAAAARAAADPDADEAGVDEADADGDPEREAGPSRRRGIRRVGAAGVASAAARGRDADANTTAGHRKDSAKAGTGRASARAGASAGAGRRLAKAITALLVIAVLLAALLLVQLIKGPGNGGKQVAREDRSQEALQAANTKLPKLYSYDYRQIDANIAEQLQLTTGDINAQIQSTTAPALKQLAPKVKAIVQAVSVDSAVLDDSGPDVQVLIFLNQAVNSSLLPAARLDRNRIVATMRLVDGQWKVAGIKAL